MIDERSTEAVRGAMLAFAVGDALGWPLETRGRRVGGTRELRPELALRPWVRREGGRYAPHEEQMPGGVYSDDTQLTLAVARSLSHGSSWWEHLTKVELPWWSQYELGGGGATKRAAQSWAKGTPPWTPTGAKGYWTAGGNGAAMRVLPHCVRFDDSFAVVRRRVIADGAATHGDPVALVGAQLYAYALWLTLRRREPLGWGQLLDEVLVGVPEWAELDPECVPGGWEAHVAPEYFERWGRTIDETSDLLEHARAQISQGALAIDEEVLDDLGCFSSKAGAGTVTAAGALYLASRHAAEPEQGLVRAAFARGADTDTLAAMTGALLGALHGPYWLGAAGREVMDAELLGHALLNGVGPEASDEPYSLRAEKDVEERLAHALPDTHGRLPFYGDTEIIQVRDLDNRKSRIRSWWFRNATGQTFRIKRTSRAKKDPWIPLRETSKPQRPSEQPNGRIRSGLVVRVTDISRARAFYESLIGLPVSRETSSQIVLGGWLALERSSGEAIHDRAAELDEPFPLAVTLYAPQSQFQAVQRRLEDSATSFEIREVGSRATLRTRDPDGTPVEIRMVA